VLFSEQKFLSGVLLFDIQLSEILEIKMKRRILSGAIVLMSVLAVNAVHAAEKGIACEILNPDLLRQHVQFPADAVGRPAQYGGHDMCFYTWPVKDAAEKQAAWQKEMMASVTKGKGVPPYPKLENSVSLTWIKTDDSEEQAEQRFEQGVAVLEEGITVKTQGNQIKATTKSGEALPQVNDPEGEQAIKDAEKQLNALPQTGKDVEVTMQASFERIEGVGDQAAYAPSMRSLLVRAGKQRMTVNVRHEDGPELELELAKAIAQSLIESAID
jgi:hypothetical protein